MRSTIELGVLEGVPLLVEVELGRCPITLAELINLKRGTVISLTRPAGGPLDLYIGGNPAGRTEVVSQAGKRRVRIAEVGHVW